MQLVTKLILYPGYTPIELHSYYAVHYSTPVDSILLDTVELVGIITTEGFERLTFQDKAGQKYYVLPKNILSIGRY